MSNQSFQELLFLVIESPEGGFEARAVQAPIFTDGETLDEVKANIVEAVEVHFEEHERPSVLHLHFTREEVIVL